MQTEKNINIENQKFVAEKIFEDSAWIIMDSFINIKNKYEEISKNENLSPDEYDLIWELIKVSIWIQIHQAYANINDVIIE